MSQLFLCREKRDLWDPYFGVRDGYRHRVAADICPHLGELKHHLGKDLSRSTPIAPMSSLLPELGRQARFLFGAQVNTDTVQPDVFPLHPIPIAANDLKGRRSPRIFEFKHERPQISPSHPPTCDRDVKTTTSGGYRLKAGFDSPNR